jgi:NAD(P) transhydrogenase
VYDYDVLIIGSGPGGQKAAIAAAKLDRRVGIVERKDMIGGVCLNTGTIPSKTLREAILYLTGLDQREMYGQSYRVKDEITVADLAARTSHVVSREMDVVRSQLSRNRVTILSGTGSFTDPHTLQVDDGAGRIRTATADKIVIATGTRPARPASVEFDERTIIDSDGIVNLEAVPRSMVVAGAGVIGIEYASMFAALGTKVTVVEQRERMLEFCDVEVVEALKYHLRDLAVTFRFGETVASVERRPEGAIATLLSGKKIPADTVMYSAGRQGASEHLDLGAAGLGADKRGRIVVDEFFRTEVQHIYAVGDVIGFPALAATSMEQGRLAALHACGEPLHALGQIQPIGIYSIPEISYVGRTEEQLTHDNVPFEVGVSRYRELARGQIIGDSYGVLKLLVSLDTHTLLGVHVFGTGATELVHIGQAVMGCGGTVDYLVDAVFNYPTLAEAYKVAALDAMNKMRQIARFA